MNVKLENARISAIVDYHGAELKSYCKDGHEYMWNGDPTYWNRTSPVLFPFVGAVADGVYRHDGIEYKMGQHGFARDMEFELVEAKEDYCKFSLKSNEETKAKYPFDFELNISYKLSDDSIDVIWEVINTGLSDLQFSIGAHPAFNCNLNETAICIRKNGQGLASFTNSVFGKGLLTAEKAEVVLNDGIMELNEHSFDGDAYVIENEQADQVDILTKDYDRVLSVKFSSPLVGIWSPPGKNAPFICIEPWYGRADKEGYSGELKNREWNNSLAPKKSFKVSYTIQ